MIGLNDDFEYLNMDSYEHEKILFFLMQNTIPDLINKSILEPIETVDGYIPNNKAAGTTISFTKTSNQNIYYKKFDISLRQANLFYLIEFYPSGIVFNQYVVYCTTDAENKIVRVFTPIDTRLATSNTGIANDKYGIGYLIPRDNEKYLYVTLFHSGNSYEEPKNVYLINGLNAIGKNLIRFINKLRFNNKNLFINQIKNMGFDYKPSNIRTYNELNSVSFEPLINGDYKWTLNCNSDTQVYITWQNESINLTEADINNDEHFYLVFCCDKIEYLYTTYINPRTGSTNWVSPSNFTSLKENIYYYEYTIATLPVSNIYFRVLDNGISVSVWAVRLFRASEININDYSTIKMYSDEVVSNQSIDIYNPYNIAMQFAYNSSKWTGQNSIIINNYNVTLTLPLNSTMNQAFYKIPLEKTGIYKCSAYIECEDDSLEFIVRPLLYDGYNNSIKSALTTVFEITSNSTGYITSYTIIPQDAFSSITNPELRVCIRANKNPNGIPFTVSQIVCTLNDDPHYFSLYDIGITRNFITNEQNSNTTKYPNLTNKKITVIGDSITEYNWRAQTNWAMYLAEWGNCSVQNLGISGTGFLRSNRYLNRIDQIQETPDIIGVACSFNDLSSTVFESGGSWTNEDNKTAGKNVIRETFNTILNNYPTTPVICYCQGPWLSARPGTANSDAYIECVREVCLELGIPFFDQLYKGGTLKPWIQANSELYYTSDNTNYPDKVGTVDTTHPNSVGFKVVASYLVRIFNENVVQEL